VLKKSWTVFEFSPKKQTRSRDLRDYLGRMGTKFGSGIGECGSCTVLIEGEAVRSCQISAEDAERIKIRRSTIDF
jgi:aerobic-type carbon monoxide dehydrogenase small subunit (CoxS/CutS family)